MTESLAAIAPVTDLDIDPTFWTAGVRIPGTRLSTAFESGVYRPDVVIYTGTCKRAIRRVQQAMIDVYFTRHSLLIVNGVLLFNDNVPVGTWKALALVNMGTVKTDYQTKQLF